MLKYEWRKLLFYRKGIFLILLFLIAELLGIVFFTTPYDRELEENRTVYETYLEQAKGSLTPEKRAYLEEEMSRLNQVHRDMEGLKQGYYTGEISESEYETQFPILLQDEEKYIGFSKLYTQYIFVREQENRSFLYTGGWEKLLTKQNPDYLFFLLLLLLLTPVFCEEYSSHMHEILLTQKKSARKQVPVKLCMAFTLTAALVAVTQLMQLGYCALRFGLPDGSCSLQSLYSFGNSPRNMTLWQAFGFCFAVTEIGYLYAALLILFLSVFLKKVNLTIMSGIALLPLPLLAAGGGDAFIKAPTPWALTTASVYLKDCVKPISNSEILFLFGVVLAIMLVMVAMITGHNKNHHCRTRLPVAVFGIFVVVLLSGCGKKEAPVYYNSRYANAYETENYRISGDYMGYTIEKKATGETAPFPMTGTAGKTAACISNIFGKGDKVYYLLETTMHPNAGYDTVSLTTDLIELDLSKMQEKILYHWDNPYERWFFGLLEKPETEKSYYGMEMLFVKEDYLYYRENMNILRISLLSGGVTEVFTCESIDLSYDGRNIYYLDDYCRLTIFDLSSGTVIHRDDIIANQFFLTEDGIYYSNRREGNRLYLWTMSTDTISVAESIPEWIQENLFI